MFSLIPPVFVDDEQNASSNGNSNPFRIVMYGNAQSTAAVLAQEMREFGLKWRCFTGPAILIAAAMMALGRSVPWGVAAFVVFCAGMLLSALPSVKRWLECHGHEVEVQAAALLYGEDPRAYRLKEAETMQRGYAGLFDHLTVGEVYDRMEDRAPVAERYVARRVSKLRAYQQRFR